MLLRRASAAVEPEEIGDEVEDREGEVGHGRTPGRSGVGREHGGPGEGRVGDLAAQHGGDVGLEQFERGAVPASVQPARVGVQVQHGVPELLVVAVHLLDDLLRAADQRRAALDEVLQRREDAGRARAVPGRPGGPRRPAGRRRAPPGRSGRRSSRRVPAPTVASAGSCP